MKLDYKLSSFPIAIAVGVIVFIPAMIFGIPGGGPDFQHHFRFALPFYEGIRNWDLYPGWLAESNGGYGDPSFRFYPPGLYYLLAISRVLTGDWYFAVLITFTFLSAIGAVGAYFWARSYFLPETAVFAGVLYVFAPYHLNEVYGASLLAEFAGASALPFAFAFVERVCREGGKRNIAGLAASYALLVCTHLPLAVIGSLSLLVYALACLEKEKFRDTLGRLSLSVFIGLAASSFFWGTMISELSWIRKEDNPLVPEFLLWFVSNDNLNVWWLHRILLATLAMFLPAVAFLGLQKSNNAAKSIRSIVALSLFAFLMTTKASAPIWELVPGLKLVQFPWRWLIIFSAVGSIVAAGGIPFFIEKLKGTNRLTALIVLGAALCGISFTVFQIVRDGYFLNRSRFEALLRTIPGSPSISYWIPKWSNGVVRKMDDKVEIKDRAVIVKSWGTEKREFDVSSGTAAELRVRTFYYPYWTASAGGNSLPIHPSSDGAILISVPPEAASVELMFREPVRAKLSVVLSTAAWILIAALSIFGGNKNNREVHKEK